METRPAKACLIRGRGKSRTWGSGQKTQQDSGGTGEPQKEEPRSREDQPGRSSWISEGIRRILEGRWIETFSFLFGHSMDFWNCRYLEIYLGPMTVCLSLHSTNFVSQFFLWSSIGIYLQSSHHWHYYYIFLCCECQSLSMPNKACPKAKSFLVFWALFSLASKLHQRACV